MLDQRTRRFELAVPPHASLSIGMAVNKTAWRAGPKAVEFTVAWESNGQRRVLARQRVDKPPRPALNGWHDLTIPLEAVEGSTGTIVLQAKTLPEEEPLTDQVFWNPPTLRTGARPPGVNVILISIDTLRADHLGCYGYDRNTSPTVDGMAREGILFRHAIAASNWTLPSHASMFTGLQPSHHGAVSPERAVPRDLDTLAELLWRSGYDTAGFVGGAFIAARLGFDQGFDRYRGPGTWAIVKVPFDANVDLAIDWMSNRRDRRFFAFLHSYQVHMPYQPTPPNDTMFDPQYQGPYRGKFTDADYAVYRHNDALPPREVEHLQALYDGEIRVMDQGMAKLLDFLDTSGLAANTCILFTSDHGEEFKEHGRLFHHQATLYEELIRVPMIFWCPSLIEGGRVVEEQVGLVDVLPTLLELTGVAPPATVDGTSFYAALRGGKLNHRRSLVSEVSGNFELVVPTQPQKGWLQKASRKSGRTKALRTRRYKLISSTVEGYPPLALFDLLEDPGEQKNIASHRPEIVGQLREELRKVSPDAGTRPVAGGHPTPDEAALQRLRALGYLK